MVLENKLEVNLGQVIKDHYGPMTAELYDELAQSYFWAYPEVIRTVAVDIVWARSWCCFSSALTILDLGAGTGNLSYEVVKELKRRKELENQPLHIDLDLLDASSYMLEKAKHKLSIFTNVQLNPIEKQLENWNPQIKYDLIISSFAFHHFDGAEKFNLIHKAYESLKPGGMLVLADRMWIEKTFESEERFYRVVASRFFELAKKSRSDLQLGDVSEIIKKDFIRDGDQPSSLEEHINWFQRAGFKSINVPFTSFGIAQISALK